MRLGWWVRGGLVVVATLWVAIFAVAAWLKPYDAVGQPLRMETHRQLGLPPCNFYEWTGKPCPSCGMTTSFALLVRGDVWNSLKANAVGTLLALWGIVLIPWCVISSLLGRYLFVRSVEVWLLGAVIVFVLLALIRWVIVLGIGWVF